MWTWRLRPESSVHVMLCYANTSSTITELGLYLCRNFEKQRRLKSRSLTSLEYQVSGRPNSAWHHDDGQSLKPKCPIHTADADATVLSRRVGVGGVYMLRRMVRSWLIVRQLQLREVTILLIYLITIRQALWNVLTHSASCCISRCLNTTAATATATLRHNFHRQQNYLILA